MPHKVLSGFVCCPEMLFKGAVSLKNGLVRINYLQAFRDYLGFGRYSSMKKSLLISQI